jgi:hypothetical protein
MRSKRSPGFCLWVVAMLAPVTTGIAVEFTAVVHWSMPASDCDGGTGQIVGPVLDWTDNREKDALDEEHRQAHLLCADDGLDRLRQ